LYAITWTVTTIVMFWVGRHSDKTGERRWHVALSLLIGGLAFAVSGIHGLPGAVGLIALTVATSGVLSSMALFYTFPAALLAGTAAAAGIAWINAVGNLGGYAAPHAAGVIVDHTHSTALAMVAMAGAMMVSGLVTIYVTRKGALRR
jgi:nitrate/nitrite transporter NarK